MPAVFRDHRLLVFALMVGFAVLVLAAIITGVLDGSAAEIARSSWGKLAAITRSSWG